MSRTEHLALAGEATGVQAPLPDAESLRRAALQASWRRDLEVGRKRLRARWLVWALQRIGAVTVALGLAGWAFVALQPAPANLSVSRWLSDSGPAADLPATPAAAPARAPQPVPATPQMALPAAPGGPTESAINPRSTRPETPADPNASPLEAARPALRLDLGARVVPADANLTPSLSGDTRP